MQVLSKTKSLRIICYCLCDTTLISFCLLVVMFRKYYTNLLILVISVPNDTIAGAHWDNAINKKPDSEKKLIHEFASYIDDDVNTPPTLELAMEAARSRHSLTTCGPR
jgi:hypothetical protein